ncbi:MAG: hypothetical protein V3S46_03805 [Nitrospinota bacterium]
MRNDPLPLFCEKCVHQNRRLISGVRFCRMACKFNPPLIHLAARTFFRRKRETALTAG